MKWFDPLNWSCWRAGIGALPSAGPVREMAEFHHHFGVTCYQHSVFVSYVAFRLARRWGLDWGMCARTGLLHDLFLYQWTDPSTHTGNHCFVHPRYAVNNAEKLVPLTDKERNIILAHMWPLSTTLPRSWEAWVVSLADKGCALMELTGLWRRTGLPALLDTLLESPCNRDGNGV